jgi:hypothetical protein
MWRFEWFLPLDCRLGKRVMYLEAQGICRVETASVALRPLTKSRHPKNARVEQRPFAS